MWVAIIVGLLVALTIWNRRHMRPRPVKRGSKERKDV